MNIKKLKKRGRAVSPLIATVLMIGIVVMAASIIFVWSKKFIGEQIEKYGSRMDVVCERLDYTAQLYQIIPGEYAVVISNRGNDNIHQVNLKIIKGGNSAIKAFTPRDKNMIAKKETGNVTFSLSSFETFKQTGFDKIEVTPVLLGTGAKTNKVKLSVCKDKAMVLTLKND